MQLLGDNVTKRMQANLFGPHPQSGAFLDSCHHHCARARPPAAAAPRTRALLPPDPARPRRTGGAWNQIRIDGDLISYALQKWYDGLGRPDNKAVWKQGKAYPCDACCHPADDA